MDENLRELRKVMSAIEEKKSYLKQVKRVGTLGVTQLEHDIAIDKGLYYYQGMILPARSCSVSVV